MASGCRVDPNREARRSPDTYGTLCVTPTERGYRSDPNAETLTPVLPEERPVNKFKYYQDYVTETTTLPEGGDIGKLFDSEFSKTCSVTSGAVDHIFATLKVLDQGWVRGSDDTGEELDLGPLAIDSDGLPTRQEFDVDPSILDVWDGWLISDPTPRPYNWDGGSFAQWNQGVNIDGLQYRIEDGEQILRVSRDVVFVAGTELRADGYPDVQIIEVTDRQDFTELANPATIVGRISYEVIECVAVITDWSHYNWEDATPIKKGFRALINDLPNDVTNIYVPVIEEGNSQLKTSPDRAMWTSLGFVPESKDGQMLIYSFDNKLQPY